MACSQMSFAAAEISGSPPNLFATHKMAWGSSRSTCPSVLPLYLLIGQGVFMAFSSGSIGFVGACGAVAEAVAADISCGGAWGSSSPLQMMPPSSSTAGESKESPAALN